MLGIEDPYVTAAYILSIGSAILCTVYGIIAWNRGDDSVAAEDVRWAVREDQVGREN